MAHRIIFRNGRHVVLSREGACVAACEDFAAANELLRRLDGAGVSEALFANNKSGKIPTTIEDIRRGSIARAQARSGRSVPTWVANEQLWLISKEAAARQVANTSDEFYPAAAACYRVAGGAVRDMANKDGFVTMNDHVVFVGKDKDETDGGDRDESELLKKGYADWRSGKAYIDNAGNYRLKKGENSNGEIAPWNKVVKAAHPNVSSLHKAAIGKQEPDAKTKEVKPTPYTITDARYSKGNKVVQAPGMGGFKSDIHWLAEGLGGRYVNRSKGYVMTPNRAELLDKMAKEGGWDAHVPMILYKGIRSTSTFSHPEHTKGERVPVAKVVEHFKSKGALANEFDADAGLDLLPNEDTAPAAAAVPATFPTGSGSAREVEAHFSQPLRGQSGAYWQRLRKKKGAK